MVNFSFWRVLEGWSKNFRQLKNKWGFPKIGVPQNGWFVMETPIKMDDLGGTTIFGNTQILLLDVLERYEKKFRSIYPNSPRSSWNIGCFGRCIPPFQPHHFSGDRLVSFCGNKHFGSIYQNRTWNILKKIAILRNLDVHGKRFVFFLLRSFSSNYE